MSILHFTASAIQHINGILKKYPEQFVFRLSVKQTGCSGYMYVPEVLSEKKETDVRIIQGNFEMYVDASCVPLLKDTTVDYVQKNLGLSQLTFDNPNAESLCGCGESFNLKQPLSEDEKCE